MLATICLSDAVCGCMFAMIHKPSSTLCECPVSSSAVYNLTPESTSGCSGPSISIDCAGPSDAAMIFEVRGALGMTATGVQVQVQVFVFIAGGTDNVLNDAVGYDYHE
jgi:hypothetical protein